LQHPTPIIAPAQFGSDPSSNRYCFPERAFTSASHIGKRGVSVHKRNAKFVAPLAIASAAVLAVSTGLASAIGTSTRGEVHAYEADTNDAGNLGTVVLTGAITDTGIDNQGAGPNGSNLFVLSKGTFSVDVSKVGNKLHNLPVDQATCSSDGTVAGRIPIVPGSGTGAYHGISGTLEVDASEAFILPRLNGACDTNATEFPGVLIVKGSGTVSYKGGND
jgi:hypothetical protein